MRTHPSLLLSLLLSLPSAALAAEGPPPEARLVAFSGPEGELHGFLYLPPGPGPFPAVLWNHGSEAMPGWQPELAHFYTAHGYAFFLPHRSGQGRSPGTYIVEAQRDLPP